MSDQKEVFRLRRLKLDAKLRDILGTGKKVYFQPPNGTKIEYPCIIYSVGGGDSVYADNKTYRFTRQWEIKYLDTNPINDVVDKILEELSMARLNRRYVADHIYHDIIILYY